MASSSKDNGFGSINSNHQINAPPKVTVAEEVLDDRISELPESLLVEILSFLRIHVAIKTCILSKRWRYLWTSVDNFSFGSADFVKTENSPSIVEHVLAHSTAPKIRTLELYCGDVLSQYKLQLSRCLSFVAEKNVEYVELKSDGRELTLTESFRTCSSLTTLVSLCCSFVFDGVIEWKSLKSIHLFFSAISDTDLVNLLSGCPALESMELSFLYGFGRLEINSSKLKILKLSNCYGRDNSLEIFAPYIQHLAISGDLRDLKCRLVNVSSLVNVCLTFSLKCIKDIRADHGEDVDEEEDSCGHYHQAFRTLVQDYLQKLIYENELTLGTWFNEVLCMMQFKGVPIPELKCKYLTLELHLKKFNLYGVAGLLRASSHVEILNIDMANTAADNSLCHFELSYLAKGDNIDFERWIPSFMFPNLKKVKLVISFNEFLMVRGDWGMCLKDHSKWGFDKLFRLSEFLLRAATVLEKFIIISKTVKCKACSTDCISPFLSRLSEKLSGCPRSSANSVIISSS